jgi:trans-aconitate 2-methyltransferase
MVAAASEAFAGDPRVEVFVQDLLELSLDVEVDAVFSNATFHWITDHRTLFRRLHDALRPGGLLVAQCGGAGNIAGFLRTVEAVAGDERFGAYLRDVKDTWNFATPATTASLLRAAGFAEVRTWLEPREAKPGDPREFIRVACLGPHLERLPVELHDQFLDAVIAQSLSPLALDYVRLNIEARRPA